MSEVIYAIFGVNRNQFHFDIHLQNVQCLDNQEVIVSPAMWNLGMYFSNSLENALTCYVHFKVLPSIQVEATKALLALAPDDSPPDTASIPTSEPAADNSPTKRARSSFGSPASERVRQSEVSVATSPAADGEEKGKDGEGSGLFVTPDSSARKQERPAPRFSSSSSPLSSLPDSPLSAAPTPAPSSSQPVTINFSFENCMTSSYKVTVKDWSLMVDGQDRLDKCEKRVKARICQAFLVWEGISHRQADSLKKDLEVKIFVGGAVGDTLSQRKRMEEYLVGAAEEGERVVAARVEMWRRKDVEMDVLRRLSPTRGDDDSESEEDESEDE